MYRERIDLRAFVRFASPFSVGGYFRLPILAGGILLRSRLRHLRGHTRGRWFILAADQALEESHLDTSISPILDWRRPNSHRPLCIPLLNARRDCAPGRGGCQRGSPPCGGPQLWIEPIAWELLMFEGPVEGIGTLGGEKINPLATAAMKRLLHELSSDTDPSVGTVNYDHR